MIVDKLAKLALRAFDVAVDAAKKLEKPRYISLNYSADNPARPAIMRNAPTLGPGGVVLAPGNVQARVGPFGLTIVYQNPKRKLNDDKEV